MSAILDRHSLVNLAWTKASNNTSYGTPYIISEKERARRKKSDQRIQCLEAISRTAEFQETVEGMLLDLAMWGTTVNLHRPTVRRQLIAKYSDPNETEVIRLAATAAVSTFISEAREHALADTDFSTLRQEITEMLYTWHADKKLCRMLEWRQGDIRAEIMAQFKAKGIEGWVVGQAAQSAISVFFGTDFDAALEAKRETLRMAVKARMEHGYRWNAFELFGGKYKQEAFVFKGLRSSQHFILKEWFLPLLPRLKRFTASNDKSFIDAYGADSRLLGLDLGWVEINRLVIGLMRQDLDADFISWDHLRQELEDRNIPLPHLAVGNVLDDGTVQSPHLIWFLPKNQGVRTDAKAFTKPQQLYKAVQRGLCAELMPLGADPGGLVNFARIKNPLSPHWGVCIMNEADPISLAEWSNIVDIEQRFPDLAKTYTAVRAAKYGVEASASNAAFLELRLMAMRTATAWHLANDPRLNLEKDDDGQRPTLAANLEDALGSAARHGLFKGAKPRAAMAVCENVCAFIARVFDPAKVNDAGYRPNRGVLAAVT